MMQNLKFSIQYTKNKIISHIYHYIKHKYLIIELSQAFW